MVYVFLELTLRRKCSGASETDKAKTNQGKKTKKKRSGMGPAMGAYAGYFGLRDHSGNVDQWHADR
jgi:formylglycine-generating enzyme required for sulfatase activity